MQQLMFIKPGLLEWWDVPAPQLEGQGEALVRPVAVATCDLDGVIKRGQAPLSGPFAFGHEFVAQVMAVGSAVHSISPGQLVVVPFQIACGECTHCRRGLSANCTAVPSRSMYGFGGNRGGALSDVVRVPFADHMLVAIPDGIAPAVVASAGDNLSDAWRTVGPYLAAMPGANALIVGGGGGGSIGLYAVDIARALGASQVDYIDQNHSRLECAQTLGAHLFEGPPPYRLGPYPITVDACANPAGLACALRSTEPGGTCTSTGIYFAPETSMPLLEMYTTGMTFKTGRVQARPIIPTILELVRDGRIQPERVTSALVPWEDALEALRDPPTKLVIARHLHPQGENGR